jgi:hypothetical protein
MSLIKPGNLAMWCYGMLVDVFYDFVRCQFTSGIKWYCRTKLQLVGSLFFVLDLVKGYRILQKINFWNLEKSIQTGKSIMIDTPMRLHLYGWAPDHVAKVSCECREARFTQRTCAIHYTQHLSPLQNHRAISELEMIDSRSRSLLSMPVG